MHKSIMLLLLILLGCCIPADASDKPRLVPSKQLAKYVVENLDLSSIASSIGYRWQPNKSTFADYDFRPEYLSPNSARLESRAKDWLFELVVLNHDKNTITIGLHDVAQNGVAYNTESILQLHPSPVNGKLVASKSAWIAAGL